MVGFQDEMRIGQIGTTTRIWAEKGTRPVALKQQEFTSAYVFGTVFPAIGEFSSLITPNVNKDWMIEHLKAISKLIPEGKHAVIVMDKAAWHTSPKINIFLSITIISLPTASPELNPAEQIWRQWRQTSLANRCFDSYENICDIVTDVINGFSADINLIKSLCTRKWSILGF